MTEICVEHVLMFVIGAFLLYDLIGNCVCNSEGFSIGVPDITPCMKEFTSCRKGMSSC